MEIFSGNTGALDMHQRLDALFSNGWLPAKSIEHMPDEFNAAVVVKQMKTKHHGICSLVDLRLRNDLESSSGTREPKIINEDWPFVSSNFPGQVRVGQAFMSVNARWASVDGDQGIRFPETTGISATIPMNTATDAIPGIVELFCGGMGGWSVAASKLPAEMVAKVDHEGMAISSTLLNSPGARLFTPHDDDDGANFDIFWGEVGDWRWARTLQKTHVEALCASPPCQPFSAMGKGEGLEDKVNATGWFQLFYVARLLQRRILLIENVVGLLSHKHFALIEKLLRWAGYTIVWKGKIDPSQYVPADRMRIFIVAWNNADLDGVYKNFKMVAPFSNGAKICNDALWKNMSPEMVDELRLTFAQTSKAASRDLLPDWLRNQPGNVLDKRKVHTGLPLPPITTKYRTLIDSPWLTLRKHGLCLPLWGVEHPGVRFLSKWEVAKAFGFAADVILPEPEEDAFLLLGNSLLPCQAMIVLGSALEHRPGDPMGAEEIRAFITDGIQELASTWRNFDLLVQVTNQGWATLELRGDIAAAGPQGRLAGKIGAWQVNIASLTRNRERGCEVPCLTEETRMLYEEMFEDKEDEQGIGHQLFCPDLGRVEIRLDGDLSVQKVSQQIAEYLNIPPPNLVVIRIQPPFEEMGRWILAGDVRDGRDGEVLIIVDTALPIARWANNILYRADMRQFYFSEHTDSPMWITINEVPVHEWPIQIQSGDYVCLRWDGHTDMDEWPDFPTFRIPGPLPPTPPDTPGDDGEDGESSDIDESGDESSEEGAEGAEPDAPASSVSAAPEANPVDHGRTATMDYNTVPSTLPTMPWSPVTSPPRKSPTKGDHDPRPMKKILIEDGASTVARPSIHAYGDNSGTQSMASSFFMVFQGQCLQVNKLDARLVGQIAEDHWGFQEADIFMTINGKPLSLNATPSAMSVGATVQIRGRLRGGTQSALQKLKGLLLSKGVANDNVDARIEEIREKIGDRGIREIYTSFDPWSTLKSRCGTMRLVKESELKQKPKAKGLQENDPLQDDDPWKKALQERDQWKMEPSFFKKEDGSPPMVLQKITHGACGIAMVYEKEASMLVGNEDHMSSEELAILLVGGTISAPTRFSSMQVEFPCRTADDQRVLLKAQLVNLGTKKISLAGEDSKVTVDEVDSIVVGCDIVHKDVPSWNEVVEGTVRFLKKQIPTLEKASFANWGRRFYTNGRQVQDGLQAESCHIMLRVKREFRDVILKEVVRGIYLSPKTEDGKPDGAFKIIWFQDRPFDDLKVLANAEPASYGIVNSKSGKGIRVKPQDFTRLRQKWHPDWKPIEGAPYDLLISTFFDVQNMPLSCTKADVQKFLNGIGWQAMVLKQTKPRCWMAGAQGPPDKAVHLATHGTVLISERSAKGNGKGSRKDPFPAVVAGKPRPIRIHPEISSPAMQLEFDDVASKSLEDKFQRKLDSLQKEQQAANQMFREDIQKINAKVDENAQKQEQTNNELKSTVTGLTDTIAKQLASQFQDLQLSMQNQRQEMVHELRTAQGTLKDELTTDVRQQMASLRKRTPSPQGSAENGEKKPKQ